MRRIVLGTLLALVSTLANAQTFQWAKRVGAAGNDVALAVTTDASGNVYTTGYFTGTVDLDPGPATLTFTAPSGSADIFISKFNSSGSLVWARQMGGSSTDVGNAIHVDASENVYIGGTFATTCDFDPGAATYNVTVVGFSDAFVAKLDASGNFVWASIFGGTGNEQVTAITLDASGNVHSTGFFHQTCDFDPGVGTYNLTAGVTTTQSGVFVSKLTNAGAFTWAGFIGNGQFQQGTSIAVDATGFVYVGGYYVGGTDFDPGAGVYGIPFTTGGGEDAFVLKLTSAGAFVHAVNFAGPSSDRTNALKLDASGNVIATGFFNGTADFDVTATTVNLVSAGQKDIFVAKLSPSLALTWARRVGSTADDMGNGIMSDASDNVYSVGYFQGTTDFDPGAGTSNLVSAGGYDAYLLKLNSAGLFTYAKKFGGTAGDYGFGVNVDGAGNSIYTVGHFGGTCDFDPDAGVYNLVSGGTQDLFIQKMGFCVPPSAPTSSNVNVCYNSSASLSATGSGTLGWYTASSGGTYLGAGGTYTTPLLTTTTSYYVQDSTCGAGTRTQVTVTVNAQLTSSASATPVSCNGGNNGTATVTPGGGTSPYTYSWAPSGGTSATTTGRTAGTYTCTITDAAGCTRTQTITITQPTAIASSVSSQTNILCNGGATGAAALSVSGGTPGYTYSWAPSGGTGSSISGRTAGTYTCTITDANGCTRTQTVNLTQPTAITSSVSSQTNILCNGGSTGAATVSAGGGTPGYTYAWAPSGGTAATATGLAAGTYTCTITDANGCTRAQTVTLTQPTALSSTVTAVTNVTCNGSSNGAATVSVSGGTSGYTYSWAPGGGTTATVTGRPAGVYTCTITDANGCTRTQTVSITQPAAITASVSSQTNVTCNGGSNGAATISASGGAGGFTYSWAPSGGTTASISGRTAGVYTCTITDANSCTQTQTVNITQPSAITVSVSSQSNITCNGANDGTATVSVSGGTPGYTYAWSPAGGTSATASGLSTGIYTCTVTDANTCTQTQTVSITEPSVLTASVTAQSDPSCNAATNGMATVTASGGTGVLSYSWAPAGGNAATATGIGAGTYTCTITDANGCTSTASATLTEPTVIDIFGSGHSDVTCNGGSDGSVGTFVTGGAGSYTYNWLPSGGTASSASGLTAGTYSCVVTDANSCTSTFTVTISEPGAIVSSQTVSVCFGDSFTVGSSTYTSSGIYTDVLSALNGCDSTVTTDLTVNAQIDVTTTTLGNTATANQSGATYQWIDCLNGNAPVAGATNQSFTPQVSGDYAVVITVGSCSDTSSCTNVITGIESNAGTSFNVYPNPANGVITVQLTTAGPNSVIEIFNATGQLVSSEKPLSSSVTITLPEEKGIYLVRVTVDGASTTTKVINE